MEHFEDTIIKDVGHLAHSFYHANTYLVLTGAIRELKHARF